LTGNVSHFAREDCMGRNPIFCTETILPFDRGEKGPHYDEVNLRFFASERLCPPQRPPPTCAPGGGKGVDAKATKNRRSRRRGTCSPGKVIGVL